MRSLRFKKIDAFTGPGSPGNPAGCVYLEAGQTLPDAAMLNLARQLKGFVSEVAFVWPEAAGPSLRYFSSEREVNFCGHATIAAMVDLFGSGALAGRIDAVIQAGGGSLPVRYEPASGSAFIAAPPPRELPVDFFIDDMHRALGTAGIDLDGKYEVAHVNAGLNSLLVPFRRAATLTDVNPDFEGLATFCEKNGIDIVVLYTDDCILPGSRYRTRVFAPRFGYLEDPATGSGNAALGCWLLEKGFWTGDELVIEQGKSYKAPNIVRLRTAAEGGRRRVLFGGGATVRIDGTYCLYDD